MSPAQRRVWAHPRAGGENEEGSARRVRSGGSSPRGRGKRRRDRLPGWVRGLIPARAGKTVCVRFRSLIVRAHPRAGGENARVMRLGVGSAGSSPRGRGKRKLRPNQGLGERLIPARAGKTFLTSRVCQVVPAHPRAGGENVGFFAAFFGEGGSSPRGRGKRRGKFSCRQMLRLIPARAGKTLQVHFIPYQSWAHPRAGGENSMSRRSYSAAYGSSPRGRGKRPHIDHFAGVCGLIPARAGKTNR